MLRASQKRKVATLIQSMMMSTVARPSFDDDWPADRWFEIPIEPDEPKECRVYGKDRNGRAIRRYVRWRFARHMDGEGSYKENASYKDAVAWARANLGDTGWSMNRFRGRWMFISFHSQRKAARFKLIRC